METAISHRRLPPEIYRRQTSWLHGLVHARDRVPHQFFARRSTKQNDHRHSPHHISEREEVNPDSRNFPRRVKRRGNTEGPAIEEKENLSIYDFLRMIDESPLPHQPLEQLLIFLRDRIRVICLLDSFHIAVELLRF